LVNCTDGLLLLIKVELIKLKKLFLLIKVGLISSKRGKVESDSRNPTFENANLKDGKQTLIWVSKPI